MNLITSTHERIKVAAKQAFIHSPYLAIPIYLILSFVYLSPPNPLTKSIKIPVNKFMNTYFSQGWQLFAPNPGYTTIKLAINCKEDDIFTGWFDPVEGVLENALRKSIFNSGDIGKAI